MSAVASQTREEFLAVRRTFLGGTCTAAHVGKHKYKTALAVYAEKALGIDPDEDDERLIAEMGIALEPIARRQFSKIMGMECRECPMVRHPLYPFIGGSPDGEFTDEDGAEIKTHGFATRDEWGEEMTDEIPDAYHVQCIKYCGLKGWKRCYVLAFDRDTAKCRLYCVEANPAYYEALVSLDVAFWKNHIEPKIEPKATRPEDLPIVRAIYSAPPADLVIATDEADEQAATYLQLQALEKNAKKELDALKAQLIQAIGNASGIQTASGTFTYKADKNGKRSLRAPSAKEF